MNIDDIIKVVTEIQDTCYRAKQCSECPFSQLRMIDVKGNRFSNHICAFKWTPTIWKIDILNKKGLKK